MAETNSPGSSPPELPPLPVAYWEDIRVEGSGPFATWTRMGCIPWQVEWTEALQYGQLFYEGIAPIRDSATQGGSRLAAVLVALYQEEENGPVKSMVFISSIPRGINGNGAHGRLEGANGGHAMWRSNCWRVVPGRPSRRGGQSTQREISYASHMHAEDNAINMLLEFIDLAIAQGRQIYWLGDNSMLVYGISPRFNGRDPSQVLPCAPEDRHNAKRPSCQEILDRMSIKWRFGIGYQTPSPEPSLPTYPPDYTSGGDGGGGYGGGGPPASGVSYYPETDYGSYSFMLDSSGSGGGASGSASAFAHKVLAWRDWAARTKRGAPVHPSPSRRSRTRPDFPNRHNTHPVGSVIEQLPLPDASLSHSLAKLSLGGKKTRTPARPAVDKTAVDSDALTRRRHWWRQ